MFSPRRHVTHAALTATALALLLALTLGITATAHYDTDVTVLDSVLLSTRPPLDPAPPPDFASVESFAASYARGPLSPLNLIAVTILTCVTVLGVRAWHASPRSRTRATTPVLAPPSDLPPAVAGALTIGVISSIQLEATLLDLARRGALTIEPEPGGSVRVWLIDESVAHHTFERRFWDALEAESDARRMIPGKRLPHAFARGKPAREALRQDLQARGWYSRDAVERRRPAVFIGLVMLLLAAATFMISVEGQQSWAFLGVGLLAVAGFGALVNAFAVPETTREGDRAAQPWRGYLKGLQDANHTTAAIDLDQTYPYALAMGAKVALDARLQSANAQGYQPIWLGQQRGEIQRNADFYRSFNAFHDSVRHYRPPTS